MTNSKHGLMYIRPLTHQGVTSDAAKIERKNETNKKNPKNLSQKVLGWIRMELEQKEGGYYIDKVRAREEWLSVSS